jgi:hypothetical protein
MSKFEMGPRPEDNGQESKESKELSPEAQKIAAGLESLAEEKNQMAIRVLCAGQGKEHGSFHMEGIGFRLLGNPGEKLETMQLQVEVGNKSYNFGSWGNNLEGLAQDLASSGLSTEQLDNYLEVVSDTASRIERQGDQWVITQYGPNNDGVKSFEDFLNE